VPGHVTTFAYMQDLFVRGLVGFEASVLTMNTRAAVLFEGIANNGVLRRARVTEVQNLPTGTSRSASSSRSCRTTRKIIVVSDMEGEAPQKDVAATLRQEFLVSAERADKLSGAWGRHRSRPDYLPAYRAGTELVARLRRGHPPRGSCPRCTA